MLTDTFLIGLKQKYLDAISQYNTGAAFEKREWEFLSKAGRVEVNVSRGGLFEKACVSTIHATVVIPGRDYQSTIQWVGIQTFPANPHIPIFMGVFEHVSEQGLERCPGFFDVFPTIAYEEDRQLVKQKMEAIMKKHGRTYQGLEEGYLKMFQLKEAGSGIGYGVGVAFGPEEENAHVLRIRHRKYSPPILTWWIRAKTRNPPQQILRPCTPSAESGCAIRLWRTGFFRAG